MSRYYVTGVNEADDELVIQVIYVGDDPEAAAEAASDKRDDYDRVILKDRDGDPVEF